MNRFDSSRSPNPIGSRENPFDAGVDRGNFAYHFPLCGRFVPYVGEEFYIVEWAPYTHNGRADGSWVRAKGGEEFQCVAVCGNRAVCKMVRARYSYDVGHFFTFNMDVIRLAPVRPRCACPLCTTLDAARLAAESCSPRNCLNYPCGVNHPTPCALNPFVEQNRLLTAQAEALEAQSVRLNREITRLGGELTRANALIANKDSIITNLEGRVAQVRRALLGS
jgi:hypothetical protein